MRKRKENCKEKNRIFIGTVLILLIIVGCIAKYAVDRSNENAYYKETNYNMAFGQLVYYVESLENWLAKATISTSGKNSIETLTEISRQSDLAVTYLSQVPLSTRELTKTAKFLNQLSEYSHSLSRKAISNEELSQEDLENIEMLHNYSVDLKNGLSQMYADIENGIISWNDITNASVDNEYVQEVDNISLSTLVDIDNTFSSYAGLIYDGAFSEHIEKEDKKALEGKDVSENEAKEQARKMKSGKYELEDYLTNLKQIKKLRPLENIIKMLPGAKKMGLNNVNIDPKKMAHVEAIVLSMTPEERRNPDILKASRKQRIANGSGTTVAEVNQLLKQFEEMKKMMKMLGNKNFKLPF